VCRQLGRRFVLVDENPVAVRISQQRLSGQVSPVPLRAIG
jgi:hypothetical protein